MSAVRVHWHVHVLPQWKTGCVAVTHIHLVWICVVCHADLSSTVKTTASSDGFAFSIDVTITINLSFDNLVMVVHSIVPDLNMVTIMMTHVPVRVVRASLVKMSHANAMSVCGNVDFSALVRVITAFIVHFAIISHTVIRFLASEIIHLFLSGHAVI